MYMYMYVTPHPHLWYRLYIANVGDSRAVLCYLDARQELQATQISDVHNVYNPSEQQRLAKLGLVVEELVHFGRLGPYQVTRSVGDHAIKGGYKDVDILRYVALGVYSDIYTRLYMYMYVHVYLVCTYTCTLYIEQLINYNLHFVVWLHTSKLPNITHYF